MFLADDQMYDNLNFKVNNGNIYHLKQETIVYIDTNVFHSFIHSFIQHLMNNRNSTSNHEGAAKTIFILPPEKTRNIRKSCKAIVFKILNIK